MRSARRLAGPALVTFATLAVSFALTGGSAWAATRPANTSPPTITGVAQEGQTLSASPGTWSGTQPITYSYQWRRCDAAGGNCGSLGVTGQTYTLTAADVGFTLRVRVTARNSAGNGSATSAATGVVTPKPSAPVNTSSPTISGTAQAGKTLTAGRGTWSGSTPITYAYRWQRCDPLAGCIDITGATASTYTLSGFDVNATVRVVVTASNSLGSSSANSAQTPVVQPAPVAPQNTSAPTISGTARDGATLTTNQGGWSGTAPISYADQWQRCTASGATCVDIAGATAQTYVLAPADVGSTVRVRVTASNSAGAASATSDPTAVVVAAAPANTSPPTISGTAQAGQSLTADRGTWSGTPPISYAYQWQRCDPLTAACGDLAGATSQSYTVPAADVGWKIRIVVTASNSGGTAIGTSVQTAPVQATADTSPPTAPSNFAIAGRTDTTLATSWTASNDNVQVSGYDLYLDGTRKATVAGTTYTFSGLACGASYTLGVEAHDAAGNVSSRTLLNASTSACTDVVVTAAGDIASTATDSADTAALVQQIGPARALTLGDNAYENGSLSEYMSFYDPTWGRFKLNTSPAPGNHEYQTPGGTGYFDYFGAQAPAAYYSFDLGAWHLISLNGEIGVGSGSAQEQWLRNDLAAHPGQCVLAYWHEPRFSSGAGHGSDPSFDAFWRDLYAAGADVVLNGHEHLYERFAPQNPAGEPDVNGPREFIVGTGGAPLFAFNVPLPTSRARDDTSHGILKLTLRRDTYDWQFVPVPGDQFTDSGSGACQPAPDTTPPSTPANLAGTATSGAITLNWTASTDDTSVTGYNVYRGGALLAGTTATSFVDSSVTPGTTYDYTVKARDAAGNLSAASNTATVTAASSGSSGTAPNTATADWASGASGVLRIPSSAGATADSTERLMLTITDSSTTVSVPVPSPGAWGTPLQINVSDHNTYVWVRDVQAGDGGAAISWTGGSGTLKGTVGVIHQTSGLDQSIAGSAHDTLDSVPRSTPTQTPNGPNRLAVGIHISDATPDPLGSAWAISGSSPAGWAKVFESTTSLQGPGGTRFILPFVQTVTLATAAPASAGAAPIGASGTQESSQVIALFAPLAGGP